MHSFIFYPISIWVLNKFFKKKIRAKKTYYKISILVSVFNEEKVIEKTIRQLLKSNYPSDKMEIIIGSDNSQDSTNNILADLSKEYSNIKVHNFNIRRGKAKVLNDLFEYAKGEILIFCDANTLYFPDAIEKMVQLYADNQVGGVSGKLILTEPDKIKSASQEKTYWDAETWLKEQEGKLGILIGANGGIYSIRREYFEKIPTDRPVMDDFFISLKVLEKGKSFLFTPDAVAQENTVNLRAEFNRKIRNNSIMMSTIKVIKNLLKPSFGLVAYGLWSHKIIRWFTPVLLFLLLISNFALAKESLFFEYFLIIQLLFYASSVAGFLLYKLKIHVTPFLMSFYFVMTNLAMFIGLLKFLFKKQTAFWQSTPR